jgi:hypothetical protein
VPFSFLQVVSFPDSTSSVSWSSVPLSLTDSFTCYQYIIFFIGVLVTFGNINSSTDLAKIMGDTVIIGSGVIGLSTAFYLSFIKQPKSRIHLIDSSAKLFQCASGLAGGFLAADCMLPISIALSILPATNSCIQGFHHRQHRSEPYHSSCIVI